MSERTLKLRVQDVLFFSEGVLPPVFYWDRGKLMFGLGDFRIRLQLGLGADLEEDRRLLPRPIPLSVDVQANLQVPVPELVPITFPDGDPSDPKDPWRALSEEQRRRLRDLVRMARNEELGPKVTLEAVHYCDSPDFFDPAIELASDKAITFRFRIVEEKTAIESVRFDVNEQPWFKWLRAAPDEHVWKLPFLNPRFLGWLKEICDIPCPQCDAAAEGTITKHKLELFCRSPAGKEYSFGRLWGYVREYLARYRQKGFDADADPHHPLAPELLLGGFFPRRSIPDGKTAGKEELWDVTIPLSALPPDRVNVVRLIATNGIARKEPKDGKADPERDHLATSFVVPFKFSAACLASAHRSRQDLWRVYRELRRAFCDYAFHDPKTDEWVDVTKENAHRWFRFDSSKKWKPYGKPFDSPGEHREQRLAGFLDSRTPAERRVIKDLFEKMFGVSPTRFTEGFEDEDSKKRCRQLWNEAANVPAEDLVQKITVYSPTPAQSVGTVVHVRGLPSVRHSVEEESTGIFERNYTRVMVKEILPSKGWLGRDETIAVLDIEKHEGDLPEFLRKKQKQTILRPKVNVKDARLTLSFGTDLLGVDRRALADAVETLLRAILLGERGQALVEELMPDLPLPSFQVPLGAANLGTLKPEDVAFEVMKDAPGFVRLLGSLQYRRSLWLEAASPSLFGKVPGYQQVAAVRV